MRAHLTTILIILFSIYSPYLLMRYIILREKIEKENIVLIWLGGLCILLLIATLIVIYIGIYNRVK